MYLTCIPCGSIQFLWKMEK